MKLLWSVPLLLTNAANEPNMDEVNVLSSSLQLFLHIYPQLFYLAFRLRLLLWTPMKTITRSTNYVGLNKDVAVAVVTEDEVEVEAEDMEGAG